jgi:hypothetical protein
MTELSIVNPAMNKFSNYLLEKYNYIESPLLITAEIVSKELQPFNAHAELKDIWRIYFKSEQDITLFLLRWS